MVEIIIREEGKPSEKLQLNGDIVQAAFNSWGHLTVRVMRRQPSEDPVQDELIVFNQEASAHIIKFVKEALTATTYSRHDNDEPPF